jgi:hypothetical protein
MSRQWLGRLWLEIAIAVLLAVAGCDNRNATSPRQFIPPTATEVFNLRSKCAELAERFEVTLDEAKLPVVPPVSAVSHYHPRSNRCYVKTETTAFNQKSEPVTHHLQLFDGQTRELLAAVTDDVGDLGKHWGMVSVGDLRDFALGLGIVVSQIPADEVLGRYDYKFASLVIDKAMADDRTR